jgi:hypothetical protein
MKKLFFLLITILSVQLLSAQQIPVSWTFSSKKISNGQYEIYFYATIEPGWHVYSQQQPKDAIAEPTSFSFVKNPFIQLEGKVSEVGKLEKYKDKVLDVTAHQYSNKVTFVQKVKLKGKAKTSVTGNLVYQTCDDEKCLPPRTVNFTIALN